MQWGLWSVSHREGQGLYPRTSRTPVGSHDFPRSVRMHWLPYGAELNSGMRLLVDDKSCLDMINELGPARAVDIYTESVDMGRNEESGTQYEDEDVCALFRDENIMDLDHVQPIAEDETVQNRDKFVQGGNMLLLEGPSHGQDGVNVEEEEKKRIRIREWL